MWPPRKPIRRETEEERLLRQAKEVLDKQHHRIFMAAENIIQYIGWIRPSDVLPEEWEILEFCKKYVERYKEKTA